MGMPVAQGLVEGQVVEEALYWVVFFLMLLGVMVALGRLRLAASLAALTAAVAVLSPVVGGNPGWGRLTGELRFALATVVLALTSGAILHDVLRQRRVTFEAVCGGLCGYLLMGYLWGMLFSASERLAPGSFAITKPAFIPGGGADPFGLVSLMTYYSFATLTTVGYGDVTPVSPLARGLAWVEAVVGQFYLAVLVARLVAMHLTTSLTDQETAASIPTGPHDSTVGRPRSVAGRGRRVVGHLPKQSARR
jgi:hypothetical protein